MHIALANEPNNKTKLPKVLQPLLKGQTAFMAINDPKMREKKRTGKPVLLIAPMSVYEVDSTDLLLSIPGYGCELVTPGSITTIHLYRLGLTTNASKLLAVTLNTLYKQTNK